jgi:hypothetical protein
LSKSMSWAGKRTPKLISRKLSTAISGPRKGVKVFPIKRKLAAWEKQELAASPDVKPRLYFTHLNKSNSQHSLSELGKKVLTK